MGDLALVPLSGKLPVSADDISCGPVFCTVLGTWDFTKEAAITADPIPLVLVEDRPPPEFRQVRVAQWFGRLEVNYPWSHGGEVGALTLSFQPACPRELKVMVTPNRVRPQLPPNTPLTSDLAETVTQATVDAVVKSCPSSGGAPAIVEVTFRVQAPSPGSDEAGGHAHDTQRPRGTFERRPKEGGLGEARCVVVLGSQGMGTCLAPVTYHPDEVSGTEMIAATADGFGQATAKVTVEVPGLEPLQEDPSRYELVGAPNNHAGTNDPCRPTPPTSQHFQNHFGTRRLITAVREIADTMLRETGILLRVNDMSLRLGGLFDIRNNWSPPHSRHRTGANVDIGFTGVQDGLCSPYQRSRLEAVIRRITENDPVIEGNHFHAIVR